jgi:hypothetical protein
VLSDPKSGGIILAVGEVGKGNVCGDQKTGAAGGWVRLICDLESGGKAAGEGGESGRLKMAMACFEVVASRTARLTI